MCFILWPASRVCWSAANYRYRRDNKSHMPPTASSNICKGATREQTCIPKVASKLTAPLKATLAIQTCIPKVARELTAPLKATRAPTTQEYINSYNFNTQCHNKHCASNITHICMACVAAMGLNIYVSKLYMNVARASGSLNWNSQCNVR